MALAAACHMETVPTRPPAMQVVNQGGVPIEALYMRTCGADDNSYQPMSGTSIAPGAAVDIPVIDGCFDLEVRTSEGHVVGRQENLTMMAGGLWTIR